MAANSTMAFAINGKRKETPDDRTTESYMPLPIQNFLLTQTCFFIQPSQSNSVRDGACLTFERVLVQNILHGLSPTFCEAIQSISRWQLIKIAFSHVMHCAAIMMQEKINDALENGEGGVKRFEASETKLLYTLHWIILDAASECEDSDAAQPSSANTSDEQQYLHDLTSIQLFVYLFAPLIDNLQEGDFQSLKLESGLRIWNALRGHQQPDVPSFSVPVKPKRRTLKVTRHEETAQHNTNAAHIYLGKGSSMEKLMVFPFGGGEGEQRPESYAGSELTGSGRAGHTGGHGGAYVPVGISVPTVSSGPGGHLTPEHSAPLARLSDICPLSTLSGETVNLEVYCEKCNTIVANKQILLVHPRLYLILRSHLES